MRNYNLVFVIVIFFLCENSSAQRNFSALGESVLSTNHKTSKKYNVNFTFRSRYFLINPTNLKYQQQQIDVYHFSYFKLNDTKRLGLGVYYRNRDWFNSGHDELRFTQEYNLTKQKLFVRYGHRIRAEQRIINNKTIFRQRYRFAANFPLNRNKLKIGKTYLVSTIEGLLSLNNTSKPETDIRVSTQIGWKINPDLKLQAGVEHRYEAFNVLAKNNLFILTSAVLEI